MLYFLYCGPVAAAAAAAAAAETVVQSPDSTTASGGAAAASPVSATARLGTRASAGAWDGGAVTA